MIKEYQISNKIDNIFDIKEDINLLNKYIKLYNLVYDGEYKEYKINNINIISNNKTINYYEEKIIKYEIIKDKLRIYYDKKKIAPFSFYNSDIEENYKLYKKGFINLKKYENYIIIEKNINSIIE